MTSARLAWLAGVIDGEGSMEAGIRGAHRRLVYVVAITNTNEALLAEVMAIYDALGVGYSIGRCNLSRHRKVCYRIRVNGGLRVARLLWGVEPYLTAKRPQALVLLRLIARRGQLAFRRSKSVVTSDFRQDPVIAAGVAELRVLNQRGAA